MVGFMQVSGAHVSLQLLIVIKLGSLALFDRVSATKNVCKLTGINSPLSRLRQKIKLAESGIFVDLMAASLNLGNCSSNSCRRKNCCLQQNYSYFWKKVKFTLKCTFGA